MRRRFSACAHPRDKCPASRVGKDSTGASRPLPFPVGKGAKARALIRNAGYYSVPPFGRGVRAMRERERGRERSFYEQIIDSQRAERQRSHTGQVVVRGKGNPWHLDRQGLVRHYLKPSRYTGEPVDTAVDGWIVFVQQVRVHSGKHRHQGGLVIYVLEGEGHSIVDGE